MKVHLIFCLSIIGVFVVGFCAFYVLAFRFGYHPASWRTEGAQKYLSQTIAQCFTGNDADRTQFMVCAQKKLLDGMKMWGLRAFMQALEERQVKDQTTSQSITQCHDLSHAIGAAGLLITKDLNSALVSCTNICVYGCQHGVVSAWYLTGKNIVPELPGICVDGIDWSKSPDGQNGCFHEIGHAVTNIAGYDITKALAHCDQVSRVGRVDCANGVFMEMYEPATFTQTPQPLPANYLELCSALWGPYVQICYEKAGTNVFGRTFSDVASFVICEEVPALYKRGCIYALGQNIFYVYQHEKDQAGKIVTFCRVGGARFMDCIEGALLSSSVSQSNAAGGVLLCKALQNDEKRACVERFGRILKTNHSQDEKRGICDSFSFEDQLTCMDSK